jgi:hypothetical protein
MVSRAIKSATRQIHFFINALSCLILPITISIRTNQHSGGRNNLLDENGLSRDTLLVPIYSRTTANPTGTEAYVFYRRGGWSWSIPYLVGMFALAAQVRPDITPEEFWETAMSTGRTIQIRHNGKEYESGVILDPQVLIEALKSK